MLYIILPAYNEEAGLPALLKAIGETCSGQPYCVVVVDDGSTDGTAAVLARCQAELPGLEVVRHEGNRGLGEALLSGFRRVIAMHQEKLETPPFLSAARAGLAGVDLSLPLAAEAPSPDIVITLDADNTHPADRIPLLRAGILEGADLCVASRYAAGARQSGLSLLRRFLSWAAGRLLQWLFPFDGLRDYSCGYRAYRLNLIVDAFSIYGSRLIESRSFAAMVELLLKLLPLCGTVREVPLELHYERKVGASKMHICSTIAGYLRLIYRLKRANWRTWEWAEE